MNDAQIQELLGENKAKLLQRANERVRDVSTVTRMWADILRSDPDTPQKLQAWMETHASAKNAAASETVASPMVNGRTLDGTWRNVRVWIELGPVQPGEQSEQRFNLYQTLRYVSGAVKAFGWESAHTTQEDGYEWDYLKTETPLNAPQDTLGVVWTASNGAQDDGTYRARLSQRTSIATVVVTPFFTDDGGVYEYDYRNWRDNLDTFLESLDPASRNTFSRRLNDDGTYNLQGTVRPSFRTTTAASYADFHFYRYRQETIEDESSDGGFQQFKTMLTYDVRHFATEKAAMQYLNDVGGPISADVNHVAPYLWRGTYLVAVTPIGVV